MLAQADGASVSPGRPTVPWDDPGETLVGNPFEVKVPDDLAAGQYRVIVGLYDYTNGQRQLTNPGHDYAHLFTLTVKR